MEDGVAAVDVVCKSGLALMISPSGDAACVKEDSVKKLENKGWELEKEASMEKVHEESKPSPEPPFVSQDNGVVVGQQVRFSSGDFTDEIVIDTFGKYGSGKEPSNLLELRKLITKQRQI